ncbi:MAG: hypothetical protein CVV27_05055, partial [Candidatus Melainabacteria bacterium HGW-Melainabacteria-1]
TLLLNRRRVSVHDLLARTLVVRVAPRRRFLGVLATLYVFNLIVPNLIPDRNITPQLSDEQLYEIACQLVMERLESPRALPMLAEVEQRGLFSDGVFPPFHPFRNQAKAMSEKHPGQFIISGEIRFEDDEVSASYPWHCNLRRDGSDTPTSLLIDGDTCVFTGRDTRAEEQRRQQQIQSELEQLQGGAMPSADMSPSIEPTSFAYNLSDPRDREACLQNGDCVYQEILGIQTIVRKPSP